MALTPGPAVDIAAMIVVDDGRTAPPESLYLTTVYSNMRVTVSQLIHAQMSGEAHILPRREVVPHSMDVEEYLRLVTEMMDESKTVAKIAALRYMGYEVKVTGEGARVERMMPGNEAEGILTEGDVVVEAQGRPVQTATDLVSTVRRTEPGSPLVVVAERNGDRFTAQVGTKESDSEPGIAVIGILVKTYRFGHDLPVEIEIDSENIGGPSAGLMFSLGIVDALEEGSLTAGHRVAGTGTISIDGTVGPVGGVGQKVLGAERAGAEYFLAPVDNLAEAKRAARTMHVAPVGTLKDAVLYLRGLPPATNRSEAGTNTSPPSVAATQSALPGDGSALPSGEYHAATR